MNKGSERETTGWNIRRKIWKKAGALSDRRGESDVTEEAGEKFGEILLIKRGAQQGEVVLIKLGANEAFTHYAETERGQRRKEGGEEAPRQKRHHCVNKKWGERFDIKGAMWKEGTRVKQRCGGRKETKKKLCLTITTWMFAM